MVKSRIYNRCITSGNTQCNKQLMMQSEMNGNERRCN